MGKHERLTPMDYDRATEHGISMMLANRRFYMLGWERERAITQPPDPGSGPKQRSDNTPEQIKAEQGTAPLEVVAQRYGKSTEEIATSWRYYA